MAKEMTEAPEDRLVREAVELARDRKKNWIDLSLRLADRAELPDRKGTEQEFVSRFEQLAKLSGETYYGLLRMGRRLRKLRLNQRLRAHLVEVGPTKFEMLCETITAANADEMLELAKKNTTLTLPAALRGVVYAQKPWRIRFDFKREHQARVEQALLDCGARRDPRNAGLRGKEEAILRLIEIAFPDATKETSAGPPRRRSRR